MLPSPETTLLIYAEQGGPRFSYMVALLFGEKAAITQREDLFIQFNGPRLQYIAAKKFGEPMHIQPRGLVFESDIHPVSVVCTQWEGYPIFFSGSGDIPFDIFSASFYLVSRYEEYLAFTPDQYGRFPHTASIAFREGFLDIPVVQHWVTLLKKKLGISNDLSNAGMPSFLPSYDADILFQYKHQSVFKNLRSLGGHLLRGRLFAIAHQIQVILAKRPDPYDNWASLWNFLHESGKQGVFFFSANEKQQGNDRQLSIHQSAVKTIMRECSRRGILGWHPSLQSTGSFSGMQQELRVLHTAIQQKMADVRFHYLRFQLPASYRWLIELGIQREYSMGYGAVNGFRASYADTFYWFDLERNQVTHLQVQPFCYMDTAAIYHQQWTPQKAIDHLLQLQKNTRGVVKELSLVFHPHCLAASEWRMVHDQIVANKQSIT